ncbi:MAG: ImcF-related family protein [Bryobacteraceae bacterium]|jgi:type VI secretion system protein ImpL
MNYRVMAIGGLAGFYLFAFLATSMLKLTGVDLWMVRGFLAIVGLSGFGIFYWWQSRRERQAAAAQAGAGAGAAAPASGGPDEIDVLLRDAEGRLTASNQGKLGNLPAILVTGLPGSAKTNTLVHSGLDPELIAGQVYQDNAIVATRSTNVWFARQTVFVDAGGRLVQDPARWMRLVKRLEPRKLASVVGKGQQAPRAAVVCFDIEEFLKPGATDSIAVAARTLHARLGDISQALGISLPVYVLFTKADRMPFFLDYVRNLGNEEATQVFGTTLPIEGGQPAGVYAEQATQKIGAAFDALFHSLADKRTVFLAREHAGEKLPGIYEFPREFRKLRTLLVQFLVDLSKPSQLRAAPFLRGFYFSGVRPVTVTETSQPVAPRPAERQGYEGAAGATGLFRAGQQQQSQTPQPQAVGTRRVPQWIFLGHFWNDIVLADRAASAASGSSVRTSKLRRVLLACAAGLCLLYSILLIVSYSRNKALEGRVLGAAQGLSGVVAPSDQDLPSLDSLQRLEALRQELATLAEYERDGAPLSMRWGLYKGSEIYPDAYRLYFGKFYATLFGWTKASMIDTLRRLPAAPGPNDTYGPPYNTLKAYLMTTSEWRRSTRSFLSPFLLNRWSENRNVEPERMQLAQKQFDFYGEMLHDKNPFSTDTEVPTVSSAREYLKKFNADERIYQALLEEASKHAGSINYNRLFPNSAVFDSHEVRGAFTKDGWNFMQAAFLKPDQLFGGEDWVLGPQTYAGLDRSQLAQRLRGFYLRDFIQEWRAFVKAGAVARYGSLSDAANKLALLSGGQSPLLALFCLVAQNTSVDAPEIRTAFQAPQSVVPAACQSQYVGSSNQAYMGTLLKLQNSVAQVATTPPGQNDAAAQATIAQANDALLTTGQIAQTFAIDQDGNLPPAVRKLMEDPITQVPRLLKPKPPSGQALCGQFRALMAKYPFNLQSTVQATLDDVNRFFRPQDGALWQFYSQNLQNLVQKQGTLYVSKPSTMTVTPAFLNFFNRAAAFSDAAYPGGAQQPALKYTLRSDLSGVSQTISITLDGQTFTNSSGKVASKQFVWPGNPPGEKMDVTFGSETVHWPPFDGLWGTFEFFGDADERAGHLEWTLRTGQSNRMVTTASGQPVMVRFDLDMSPPVFRKGYFSGWACTADVAR